jgi:hypothetical protein
VQLVTPLGTSPTTSRLMTRTKVFISWARSSETSDCFIERS